MSGAREFGRNLRIADTIQRILAPLIADEARDHRWGMVTLTHVDVAPDMTTARLHVSIMGGTDPGVVLAALRERLPVLRTAVARSLPLKKVPALQVLEDQSIAQGARIADLLRDRGA